MKKLLLFIALTIFGLGLNAQNVGDGTTIDYYVYSLGFTITSVETAKCIVSYYTGEPVDVTIPSTVTIYGTEYSVTSISGYAFDECSSLTSIEIPNSVTSIGDYAFYSCSSLTSVTFGENSQLTSIGKRAFSDCSSLTSIEIPNSVTYIGDVAFSDCSSLTSIEIPNSVTSIGYHAFYLCSSLTSIEIPNSVTSIGYEAFYYCSSLTSIEIPNSVTSIGNSVFRSCSSLTSIEIPNSVTSIGDYAFSSCSSLTSIVVAEGNTVYDSRENCNAIIETSSNTLIAGCQNTVIPNTVTSIVDYAFNGSSLTSIEIPNSVTSIGDYAFGYCSSLTSIEIPNSVTSIGNSVFRSCSSLTSIEIPNSVTSIGDYAFEYCSSLTSVTFGENSQLTSIGKSAFYDCSSLTSIEIPNSVTSIGDYAFSDCSSLTSVTFGENSQLTSIGKSAFSDCSSLTSIEIPNSVTSIGSDAFYLCSSLTSIEIPNSVTYIGDAAFSDCSSLTSVTFGENSQLTSIGKSAFSDCSSLTSIEIPNSVTSIGEWAFYHCSSLTSIEIPNSVTYIGEGAFRYCSSLTSIICHAENVPETESSAFNGCPSDMIIYVPLNSVALYEDASPWNEYNIEVKIVKIDYDGYSLNYTVTSIESAECEVSGYLGEPTAITIPSSIEIEGIEFSVTSIKGTLNYTEKGGAFEDCSSLTSVEIPNSVTSIGDKAFYVCSNLTSIEIPNSVTSIGESAFSYCKNLTSIIVAEGNTVYDSRENCNAIIETSSNTLIAGCQNTVIPNSVASIGNYAFYGCLSLTSIEIPATIKSIGEYALASTSLRIINMEDFNQLSNIAEGAFSCCSSLEMVVLPKYISSISELAFDRCSSLKGINIPEYVTEIGFGAFYGCSNLNSVKCYASAVPTSPSNIFLGVPSNMTIQVPGASMASYLVATPWKNYILTPGFSHQITVVSNNSELGTVTGSGTYDEGVVVTLTATVNGNNEFDCWTEDGVIVSKEITYVFNATRDRVIIGNFRTDDTPQNVVAKAIDSQSIELTWNAIATASSYNVYRDGELLKNVNTNSYLDEGLEAETKYCYTITTVSASGEESEKSTEACAKTMKENSEEPEDPEESIEELSSSIKIYPNPVENELFLATELRVEEIAIYDVYGRHTMSQQANETTSQQVVEVADLEAGVYFMKVVTNEGEIVKRFVKK